MDMLYDNQRLDDSGIPRFWDLVAAMLLAGFIPHGEYEK